MQNKYSKKVRNIAECVILNLPIPDFIEWFTTNFTRFFPNFRSRVNLYWDFEEHSINKGVRLVIKGRRNYDPNSLYSQLGATAESNAIIDAAYIDLIGDSKKLDVSIHMLETDTGPNLRKLFNVMCKEFADVFVKSGESLLDDIPYTLWGEDAEGNSPVDPVPIRPSDDTPEEKVKAASALGTPKTITAAQAQKANLPALQELIVNHFKMDEIAGICFQLKVQVKGLLWEDIKRNTITSTAQELAEYMERRSSLHLLINHILAIRPNITKVEINACVENY